MGNNKSYKSILVFGFCFFLITSLFAQWPQWRGPNRDGVCTETNLMKIWPEEGPKLLWSVDSLGDSFSSTAIEDKMVYTIGKRDSVEILTALNTEGNIIWQTPYGRAKKDNSWPQSRCTPTVYNGSIYAVSVYGDLACVDAKSGDILWQVQASEKFGSVGYNRPNLGISESLLIVNDKIISTPAGNLTTMVALDCKTGELIWQTESLKDSTFYTSPIVFPFGNKKVIFTSVSRHDLMVDPDSGKILWNDSIFSGIIPLIVNDKIYATGQYKRVGALCSWDEQLTQRSVVWRDSVFANPMGGAVLFEDKIIVSGDPKGIYCIDPETGKTISRYGSANYCNFLVAGDRLYSFEDKGGKISLFKLNDNQLELVGVLKITLGKGPRIAHMAIADGVLFVRRGEVLMAYNVLEN